MIVARVSHIESYRRWKNWRPLHDNDLEPTVDDLVHRITTNEPTEAMLAGTAFHKALELASEGSVDWIGVDGYRFNFNDDATIELPVPVLRELRGTELYCRLMVTGQVDGILKGCVVDYKTTKRFDAESYLNGCQWKFYLSIFKLDIFQWNVFEIKEVGEKEYNVQSPHILKAYRYPELEDDCKQLASEYFDFAKNHLPSEYSKILSTQLNLSMESA